MYTYYILRNIQQGIELEGEIIEGDFPGIDLRDGLAIIAVLIQQHQDGTWHECDLSNDYFEREDRYLFNNGRWIRRSEIAIQNL